MKKLVFMILITAVLAAAGAEPAPSATGAAASDTAQINEDNGKNARQVEVQSAPEAQKGSGETPEQKKEELDEIEKARQALQYGLESEILEVTGKIDKQDFEALQNDFIRLVTETKSAAVREGLFALYQKYDNALLTEYGLKLLQDYDNQQRTLVKAVLSYLSAVKPELGTELNEALRKIITEETAEYGAEAIAVLGETGGSNEAVFLAEYYDTFTLEDAKQELILKQAIASALEKLHSEDIRDFLLEHARDENENTYIRASAVAGLAQMGGADIVPLLGVFFEQRDPLLREAAMRGAAAFDTEETRKLVLQGFKDGSYKVRLEALKAVQKTKQQEAAPYVLYRAKYDPTEAIRLAAVETLAILNTAEGNAWLSETFCDPKKSEKLRIAILAAAFKHNFAVIAGDVDRIVLQTVTDTKRKKLRYELGKEIAKHENTATAEICKAFLQSDDVLTESIGLDMFKTNRYAQARPFVEAIAQDEKQGALQRRAQRLLKSPPPDTESGSVVL